MTSATNPESGTISHTYDNDGNLLTKTAPAPNQTGSAIVTTSFSYDALHRLTQKSYSDGTTATVKYGYDAIAPAGCTPPALTITNGIGRRTSTCDGAGGEARSYDAMGRILTDRRTTNSVTKDSLYTYNLDGSVATLTYPSGRTVTYSYNAAARSASAIDSVGPINYATSASYAPTSALASLTNGPSVVSTFFYNSRLQPCRISVRTAGVSPANCTDAANIGNVLDFQYDFALGTANNGNVMGITNNRDTLRSQTFTYDELNRVSSAKTNAIYATSPAKCWGETFSYDIWANLLTISPITPQYTGCTQENLTVGATIKNQISGNSYDSAENLLSGPGMGPFTYDAQNRLLTAGGVTYSYDGDGKRVQKSNAKMYWYGMGSDPLTETDLAGTPSSEFVFFNGKRTARLDLPSAVVHYYFSDHLGSGNLVTSSSGAIQDESDFYPFGGERIVTNSDPDQYKFTGKEHDLESGLDFFIARYYASNFGRFTSPDEFTGGPVDAFSTNDPVPPGPLPYANASDPRSLNKYAYALNNPLRYIDPTGHSALHRDFSPGWPKSDDPEDWRSNCPPRGYLCSGQKTDQRDSPKPKPEDSEDQDSSKPKSQDSEDNNPMKAALPLAAGVAVIDSPVPGPADVVALGIIGTAVITAAIQSSRNKQTVKQLEGLQRTIEEHIGKVGNNPNDPNRGHWKEEVRRRID